MLAIALAAAALSSGHPALKMVSADPVTFRGTHFASKERVTVRLSRSGAATRRRVHTSRRGRFRVTFSGADATQLCSGMSVRAVGVSGDSATLVRRPPPECAAP